MVRTMHDNGLCMEEMTFNKEMKTVTAVFFFGRLHRLNQRC